MVVLSFVLMAASTPVHAQTYLLDEYPDAYAAYSLRKLSSTYTGPAIRVRRSSDDAEQDIGFGADDFLDTAALTAFVGSGDGYVTTWYSQIPGGDMTRSDVSHARSTLLRSEFCTRSEASLPCKFLVLM
ncbi:MAG: hypothetical protein KatS3mg042_0606 [Rhodothermaceae bacterium]|nr:MAG: hypothetical protein KatS3mg042_0606 [Rhodothermaceae bacterium]